MGKPGQGLGFLLWVDDIDGLHAQALSRDLEPDGLADSADGKRLFDISDSFGNILIFIDS